LQLRRIILLLFEVGSGVHAETSSSTTEAITLWSEFSAMTSLAVKNFFVHVGISRVKHFVAHTALVAFLVEGNISDHSCLCVVDRLVAFWALGVFDGFERHFCVGGCVRDILGGSRP